MRAIWQVHVRMHIIISCRCMAWHVAAYGILGSVVFWARRAVLFQAHPAPVRCDMVLHQVLRARDMSEEPASVGRCDMTWCYIGRFVRDMKCNTSPPQEVVVKRHEQQPPVQTQSNTIPDNRGKATRTFLVQTRVQVPCIVNSSVMLTASVQGPSLPLAVRNTSSKTSPEETPNPRRDSKKKKRL